MTTITHEQSTVNYPVSALGIFRNSRMLKWLAVLLVVQLAVAVFLAFSNNRQGELSPGEPVLALPSELIRTIEIDDQENSIVLQKNNDQWQFGKDQAFPVLPSRINNVLTSLDELKTGLPIANSIISRKQLQVGDDDYQRKIVITGEGAETVTLLLGTSPAMRKAHLRRQDSDDIYSATLPVSEVSASPDHWLDKTLLSLDDISLISSAEVTFKRDGSDPHAQWALVDAQGSEKLDVEKLAAAVNSLAGVRVNGFAMSPVSESGNNADESSTAAVLNVTSGGNDYEFTLTGNTETATVSRGDIDGTFSISTAVFNELASLAQRSDWLLTDTDDAEETPVDEK